MGTGNLTGWFGKFPVIPFWISEKEEKEPQVKQRVKDLSSKVVRFRRCSLVMPEIVFLTFVK